MNEMDEISFWIYTKQAPCLMTYDNVIKKQCQAARASLQVQSCHTISDDSTPPTPPQQKKKRKLSILEDSGSTRDPQNVFFESSNQQVQEQTGPGSDKSESSIFNLNVNKSSIQNKHKRTKATKNTKTIHRKIKIVSSTPKVNDKLRRSLRNSKKCLNDDSALDTSLDIFDVSHMNGHTEHMTPTSLKQDQQTQGRRKKLCDKILYEEDLQQKNIETKETSKYEDLSDVSGFTANYIRSTKIDTTKNGKNLKINKNLFKESKQKPSNKKMVICMNKGVNTGLHEGATCPNCSSGSSQNCLNLMTTDINHKQTRVNRSTSILKFMPINQKCTSNTNLDTSKDTSNINSLTNGSSRYPKRLKNSYVDYRCDTTTPSTKNSSRKRKINKKTFAMTSGRKENNTESSMIKTRSRRRLGLNTADNTVLVLTNSTEQFSTPASLNVASARNKSRRKRRSKHSSLFINHSGKSGNKCNNVAGLSDSEDERPLRPRYFS